MEIAKQCITEKKYDIAIDHLENAQIYPDNLGEGKLSGAQENDIFFWQGCIFNSMGESVKPFHSGRKPL